MHMYMCLSILSDVSCLCRASRGQLWVVDARSQIQVLGAKQTPVLGKSSKCSQCCTHLSCSLSLFQIQVPFLLPGLCGPAIFSLLVCCISCRVCSRASLCSNLLSGRISHGRIIIKGCCGGRWRRGVFPQVSGLNCSSALPCCSAVTWLMATVHTPLP